MKRISILTMVTVALMLLMGTKAKAQDGKLLVGGGLTYATEIKKPGVFVSGVYKIMEQWEAAADFTYFFPETIETSFAKTSLTWMAFNLNAHYVFYNENKIGAYGIAGMQMLMARAKVDIKRLGSSSSDSDSSFGFNLGAGARYQINEKLYGLTEIKYTFRDSGYMQFNLGILYQL